MNQCPANTCTISNVLNVICDRDVRIHILTLAKKYCSGTVYITVYEGDKTGKGKVTRDGYQLNCKLKEYMKEVQIVFPYAKVVSIIRTIFPLSGQ
jgi:hypothetical protein